MRTLGPDQRESLAELTELMRQGSTFTDPAAMLRHYGSWFGRQRPSKLYLSASRRGLNKGEYKLTRMITGESLVNGTVGDVNPWRDWNAMQVHTGGFIADVMADESPRLLFDLHIPDDPVLGDRLAQMRSCMAIPNYDNGEAINWGFSFREDPDGWTQDEFETSFMRGNLLGMATRNLVNRNEVARLNAQLSAQLEQIAGIQRSLLPSRLPRMPGLKFASSYLTSNESGGDYYDFFEFADGSIGVLIADVAGHGAGAATVMAMLRAILHCYELDQNDPAAILRYANAKLIAARLPGSFVTAFFAVIDPAKGSMTWARAGHNPPRLKLASGEVLSIEEGGGLPLGVLDDLELETCQTQLNPGDTLILYTDGITEAFNAERVMFGTDGLDAALTRCSGEPECVVDTVHSALYAHTGVMSRDDDQTLVAIRFTGDEGS